MYRTISFILDHSITRLPRLLYVGESQYLVSLLCRDIREKTTRQEALLRLVKSMTESGWRCHFAYLVPVSIDLRLLVPPKCRGGALIELYRLTCWFLAYGRVSKWGETFGCVHVREAV